MHKFKMLFAKSQQSKKLTNIFHDEGVDFFKRKKYFEALFSYNKSLCHAEPNSVDMGNGFVSRSSVYFEMGHYQKCLDNIQYARSQSQYKTDRILDERENRCKEIMEHDDIIDTKNFFKLSYPAHRKIPFIVSCLELSENDKFGRFIRTNCQLRPGDVIAIEEPFFKFVDLNAMSFYRYQRCFNCLKSNKLSLLPGPHSVMSCSQACHDTTAKKDIESQAMIQNELDWKIVKMVQIKNDSEEMAGNFEKLESLFYENSKTIFDFDFNDVEHIESQTNLLKCAVSLLGGTTSKVDKNIEIFKLMLGSRNNKESAFFVRFIDHLMNVCQKTQFSLNIFDELAGRFEKIGNCLLPFGGLINHSCDPNLFWISVEGKFVYIVAKPITAGEQLFLCYRKTFLCEALDKRQKHLQKQYGFKCECHACTQNYPRKEYANDTEVVKYENSNQIQEEVTKNWREIERNFNTQSHYKTAELVAKNKQLLEYVASKFA